MSKEHLARLNGLLPNTGLGYMHIANVGYAFRRSRKAKRTLTFKVINSAILELYKYIPKCNSKMPMHQHIKTAFDSAINDLTTYTTIPKFTISKREPSNAGPAVDCPEGTANSIIAYLQDKENVKKLKADTKENDKNVKDESKGEDATHTKDKPKSKINKCKVDPRYVSRALLEIITNEFDDQLLTTIQVRHALSKDRVYRIALLLSTKLNPV